MAKITLFKDTDGKIKQAQQFEVVNREEIQSAITECEASLQSLKDALVVFDSYDTTDTETTDEEKNDTDSDVAATASSDAPVVETPAPVDVTSTPVETAPVAVDPAPVEPTAPVAPTDPTPITIQ